MSTGGQMGQGLPAPSGGQMPPGMGGQMPQMPPQQIDSTRGETAQSGWGEYPSPQTQAPATAPVQATKSPPRYRAGLQYLRNRQLGTR